VQERDRERGRCWFVSWVHSDFLQFWLKKSGEVINWLSFSLCWLFKWAANQKSRSSDGEGISSILEICIRIGRWLCGNRT
jgi:hypothetical protein